jgi:TRAP transporter 4TM/12TM fusion protein
VSEEEQGRRGEAGVEEAAREDGAQDPRRSLGFLRYLGFVGDGTQHSPGGVFGYLITAMAVILTVYEVWLGLGGAHNPLQYGMVFLTALLPITFLTTTASKRSTSLSVADVVLAATSLLVSAYLLLNIERYLTWIQGITSPTTVETIAGIALVFLVIEASRRTVGLGLTSVVLLLIAYTFLGQFIGGVFNHRPIDLEFFLVQQVFSENGIFGDPVQVAATYAFLFVLFGNLFDKAGGGQFFFDIAAALTGRLIGGPAKACVTSSGLYGSISGSPTADVATTGQVNIPLMKRVGYTGTFSGAVEATASSGGAILPPVMGAVAFLMAEFTGIPYSEIIQAAIITALLYYFGVFLQVHHRTRRWGMGRLPADQIVGLSVALKRGWMYLIPLTALVYFLFEGYTPSRIAVVAAGATLVISWFKRSTRIGPRALIDACRTTVLMMVSLAAAVAAAGIVIGCINLTGLAGKFTYLIFLVTGGYLVPALIAAMIISVLLGMGMPTPAVYVTTAALIAPPLIDIGVPLLETHLFLLYFAAMSAITPPVAVAAFTAAPIAQANPMSIGWQAVRLAIVGFVFPFVFVFRPGLLLQGGVLDVIDASVSGAIAAFALAAAVEGWFGRGPLAWWERVLLTVVGIVVIHPSFVTTVVGGVVIAVLLGLRYRNPRPIPEAGEQRPQAAPAPQPSSPRSPATSSEDLGGDA